MTSSDCCWSCCVKVRYRLAYGTLLICPIDTLLDAFCADDTKKQPQLDWGRVREVFTLNRIRPIDPDLIAVFIEIVDTDALFADRDKRAWLGSPRTGIV